MRASRSVEDEPLPDGGGALLAKTSRQCLDGNFPDRDSTSPTQAGRWRREPRVPRPGESGARVPLGSAAGSIQLGVPAIGGRLVLRSRNSSSRDITSSNVPSCSASLSRLLRRLKSRTAITMARLVRA
jgi:hypothetical protein